MKKRRRSISLGQIAAGFPALAALITGTLIIPLLNISPTTYLIWYRSAGQRAFDNSDFKTAAICYARLHEATPADDEVTFALAQSLQNIGQRESAKRLIRLLNQH